MGRPTNACANAREGLLETVMIRKEAIRKTAVTYWSKDDDCFVVESPLFDRVAGVGDTKDEAFKVFVELLDDAYEELEKDNVLGYKRGRPAKGGVNLHCQVRPSTKDTITELAAKFDDISQGEMIDFLLFYFQRKTEEVEVVQSARSHSALEERLSLVEESLRKYIAGGVRPRLQKTRKKAKKVK